MYIYILNFSIKQYIDKYFLRDFNHTTTDIFQVIY